MATLNIQVPALGESVTEAVLLRWIKQDGEYVSADEPLAELETDKANVDLPAGAAGVLRHAAKAGDAVKVGQTIARIDESAKPSVAPIATRVTASAARAKPAAPETPPMAPNTGAQPKGEDLRPSVRRLVEENRIDPARVAATGPGGRIIKEDVARYLDDHEQPTADNGRPGASAEAAPPQTLVSPEAMPTRAAATPSLEAVAAPKPEAIRGPSIAAPSAPGSLSDGFDASGMKREPMSKLRRRIAERLVHAQQTAAILTTFNEIDMSAVMALRAKYKERFADVHGASLGLMSFFARATVKALFEFPRVNAFIDGSDVVYHNYVNLGIAVSTERGLTVPVLQHVEAMSFARIESEIKRLATAARDGKLGLQELSGATFTITNGGVFGSLLSTPILSPPESGILGMHAINRRPMAIGEKIEIRPMMYIALSYDHRLVDGRESVSFLVRLKELLEDPARLLLEV